MSATYIAAHSLESLGSFLNAHPKKDTLFLNECLSIRLIILSANLAL